MVKYITLFFVAVICNVSYAQVGTDTDLWIWSESSEHHKSVVQVDVDNGQGCGVVFKIDRNAPRGPGFKAWVLTAAHVVAYSSSSGELSEAYRPVLITFFDKAHTPNSKIVVYDLINDLAIIETSVMPNCVESPISSNIVVRGDILEFAGLGGGTPVFGEIRHFYGYASSPTSEDQLYADANLLSGDSGGPIFNKEKEVAGIISGGWMPWGKGIPSSVGGNFRPVWPASGANVRPIRALIERLK